MDRIDHNITTHDALMRYDIIQLASQVFNPSSDRLFILQRLHRSSQLKLA